MYVKEIMSKDVVCADQNDTLISIARKMRERKIGAIPVCNSGKLVGVVTDRDIVTRAVAEDRNLKTTTARQVMSKTPISSRESETVEDVVHLMEQKRVRRLPVMNSKDHLVGIVSLDDIAVHTPHELSGEVLEHLSFARKTAPTPSATV